MQTAVDVEEVSSRQTPAHLRRRRICTRCIYDETVGGIRFDAEGVCNYCHTIDQLRIEYATGTPEGEKRLQVLIDRMRQDGRNKKYDCVVGVSGGTDSSFMIAKAVEWGLRPLAVHYDNTWNTAIATENIKKVLGKLGVDLYTHVVDNKEADDIIKSFFKASVPDLDCATDIALAETLYRAADTYGVAYILEGHSYIAEGISPLGTLYMDGKYIRSVHKLYGTMPMRTYPNMPFWTFMKWILLKRIKKIRPLWYIGYSKTEARAFLEREFGWQYYGGHHLENRITAFHHSYYNPMKFGIDNRNNSLSASVRAGLLSRDEALMEFAEPPHMEPDLLEYFKKRLGLSDEEFASTMALPAKSYRDYPTYKRTFERLRPLFFLLAKVNLVPMSFYIKYTSKSEI
ncbi:MAG: N-acetyl sugar amidotransferase [Bacteroidetes bacterium]|nr:N-acetyl sugar amidotransferase [Bacteroidota bacterium]MCW5897441.1 N-acetyl sugar amidotransferase [Bacteroidota bacterium]